VATPASANSGRVRAEAVAHDLSPEDQSLYAYRVRGLTISHPEWLRASRLRAELRARWQELFRNEVDVVLCPSMPTPAFPHDHSVPKYRRQIDIDGKKVAYDDQIVWAGIATLTGLPATAAPIGKSESGLPIGVPDHRRLSRGPHDDQICRAYRARVRRLHPAADLRVRRQGGLHYAMARGHKACLRSPQRVADEPRLWRGSQVRKRLAGGGRWIRTVGPPSRKGEAPLGMGTTKRRQGTVSKRKPF
jgi:Amidase